MSAARVVSQISHSRGRGKARYDEEYDGKRADLLFYRSQALGIVRHFFEIASQIGRLPSIMGREFFRAKVSHHAIPSFEEQAVFVLDVEAALARLNERDGELVALVGLFHYSMEDVARMLGRSRSYVAQHFADSVDHLAERFLETGLLREDRLDRRTLYFDGRKSTRADNVLPPKKPVVSVAIEEYRAVGGVAADYSFAARPCKA
jgi:AraC-like DNA-binding protein